MHWFLENIDFFFSKEKEYLHIYLNVFDVELQHNIMIHEYLKIKSTLILVMHHPDQHFDKKTYKVFNI